MRRPLLLAVLAVLALLVAPAAAQAAPAKISPRSPVVSEAGVASVEVANPNRHVLRGTASVTVRGRVVVKRSVRLGRLSVGSVALRFDAGAVAALQAAGGRATITLRLRRAGARKATTARRTLTLRLPAAAPQVPGDAGAVPAAPASPPAGVPSRPAPASGPAPAPSRPAPASGQAQTPAPAPAAPRSWVGRMGAEGPYDDFELAVADGQLQFTRIPMVPVVCMENGGAYRSALSLELFDAPGPWTVGADGSVEKQGISVNQLVSSGARTITFKVTGTSQAPGRVAGTLGMSFFESRYDLFTNRITFINCSGAQSFEAVPAP
jgi:hypothetical protein